MAKIQVSKVSRLPPPTDASERIALLPEKTRCALRVAAVIGAQFDLSLLRLVLEQTETAWSADDEVLAAVQAAVSAAVIRRHEEQRGCYTFVHASFRDILYEATPTQQRARLHAAVAAGLEGLYRAGQESLIADTAYHYLEALPIGTSSKAVEFAVLAAEQAKAARAHEEGLTYRIQALEAFDFALAGKPAAAATIAQRCDLLLALGFAQNLAARRPEAKETFSQGAELARRLPDGRRLAIAALGYGGSSGLDSLGGVDIVNFDSPVTFDTTCSALLREAAETLGTGDALLRARLLSRLAIEMTLTGSYEERQALSSEACSLARQLEDPRTLAVVLAERHMATQSVDNLEERLQLCGEVIPLAQACGSQVLEALMRGFHCCALLEKGDVLAMQAEWAATTNLVEIERIPILMWGLNVHRSMRAALEGRFAEAEARSSEALAIGGAIHPAAGVVAMLQTRFARRELGNLEALAAETDFLDAFAVQFPTFPQVRIELATSYLLLDRRDEAQAQLDYFAAHDFSDLRRDLDWLFFIAATADVCASLRDRRRAQVLYELMKPFAERSSLTTFGAVGGGSAARALGRLAALLEKWDSAEEYFQSALRRNGALRSRPLVAHTRYDYACMLRDRALQCGGWTEEALAGAREMCEQARQSASALQMTPLAAAAESLAAALPATALPHAIAPASTTPAESTAPASSAAVFRCEGEFWRLTFADETARCRDAKGFAYIALLLRHPGTQLQALDLVRMVSADGATTAVPAGAAAEFVLDARAKREYRQRLAELQCEIDEAESFNDLGRVTSLREEQDRLHDELRRAVGLGGRDRRTGDAGERARINVTRSINSVIRKIGKAHTLLADHLGATIRTGTFCTYRPDPRLRIDWQT